MLTSSSHTVDGTSSVHQLRLAVGRLSHNFQGFIHSRCAGYSSIKSMNMSFGGRFSGGSGKVFDHLYISMVSHFTLPLPLRIISLKNAESTNYHLIR